MPWSLTVQEGPSLALVAPHGVQPIAGVTEEVKAVLQRLAVGTEVACEGSGRNIRDVIVARIVGPLHVLEPLALELPDAWVRENGKLALERARRRLYDGLDPVEDLRAAMARGVAGVEGIVARLAEPARAALAGDYARWASTRPLSAEVLGPVPVGLWTEAHLTLALEQLVTTGAFGAFSLEVLLAELLARGSKEPAVTRLVKKCQKLQKERAKGDTSDVNWVRIETNQQGARIVGGSNEHVYLAASSVGPGARSVLYAFDRAGKEVGHWGELSVTHVIGRYALCVQQGGRSHISRLPERIGAGTIERLVEYPNGIRAFDAELVWGVLAQTYGPFEMRSEVRVLGGDQVVSFFPDDVADVYWDAEAIHVVRRVGPEYFCDTIHRSTGEKSTSGPLGQNDRVTNLGMYAEREATIETALGSEHFSPPPWRRGYWASADEQGYRLRWLKKQLFLSRPGQDFVALSLAQVPVSITLAPPWLGVELSRGHFLAMLLDDLVRAPLLRVGGKVILERAKRVAMPAAPAKLVALFDTLVSHNLLPAMEPSERDRLLLSVFDSSTRPAKSALALLLDGRSPRTISHDSHWFEASDRIVARFDATLEGEPVRFAELAIAGGTAHLEIRAGARAETVATEAFVWEVASVVDAALKKHRSSRRVYALESYQSDVFVFVVLTPGERQALIDAGIQGIGKNAMPKLG